MKQVKPKPHLISFVLDNRTCTDKSFIEDNEACYGKLIEVKGKRKAFSRS